MVTSGSEAFDKLREHLREDHEVKREVEFAFASLLTAANPSDRGLRFLFGNGAEWIMAAAAWSAGVLTAPQGHNADGFDLADLMHDAKGLWSVKASASASSGQIRLKNFMGDGANADWTEPTLFVGPYLSGAVLVDPILHPEVKAEAKRGSDALVLGGGAVKRFSLTHPANHAEFEVTVNKGGKTGDPYAFIKSVITPDHFPHLAQPFAASQPKTAPSSRVEQILRLSEMHKAGQIRDDVFQKLVAEAADAN